MDHPSIISGFLKQNPVIAACGLEQIPLAVDSPASMILLLKSSLGRLVRPDFQEWSKKKPLYIHVDMVKGLTGDRDSLQFIRDFISPAGIVSTRSTTLRAARNEGLSTVQRVFLIDSSSLKTAISSIRDNRPDAVEIMPGIAPGIYRELRQAIGCPLIAAGLIHRKEEMQAALEAGADGVSLSDHTLWDALSSST